MQKIGHYGILNKIDTNNKGQILMKPIIEVIKNFKLN